MLCSRLLSTELGHCRLAFVGNSVSPIAARLLTGGCFVGLTLTLALGWHRQQIRHVRPVGSDPLWIGGYETTLTRHMQHSRFEKNAVVDLSGSRVLVQLRTKKKRANPEYRAAELVCLSQSVPELR